MTNKTKLVCGQCATVNQFDGDRAVSAARCGKCKTALAANQPINVDTATLVRHVKHSSLPVLVDFWAPWCGPCKTFAPTFERFAAASVERIRCLKLDTEQNQQAGAQYSIRSIPTLALFSDGQEVDRISGALSASQLTDWVERCLKP